MSTMVSELFTALRAAGVEEKTAQAAAQAVLGIETRADLATKADLAEAKADIIKWTFGVVYSAIALQTGLLIFVLNRLLP